MNPRNVIAASLILVIALIIAPAVAYYTVAPIIDQGGSVFIGEQGLNVDPALDAANAKASPLPMPKSLKIGWWGSAMAIRTSAPQRALNLTERNASFPVLSQQFLGFTGTWYLVDPATEMAAYDASGNPIPVFTVKDPYLDIRVLDSDAGIDVTGRSVVQGTPLGFRIDTNLISALESRYRSPVYNATGDGYIDIKVMDESGVTLTLLNDSLSVPHPLLRQNISYSPWVWGGSGTPSPASWATGVRDSGGTFQYAAGTYTVWAESYLNNMKDNYRDAGADYTGKTLSQRYTVTLVTEALKIESNRDSVARPGRFSATITGKPNTLCYVWLNNTGTMTGEPGDQPPRFYSSDRVYQDPASGPFTIGSHPILGRGGRTIIQDVPPSTANVSSDVYYAAVLTNDRGYATFEFIVPVAAKPGTYSIRAETGALSDDVAVVVVPSIDPRGPVTGLSAGPENVIHTPVINSLGPVPAITGLKRIVRGGTVFIGESGLDVSEPFAAANSNATPRIVPDCTTVGWWASFANIPSTVPTKTVDLAGQELSFTVDPRNFVGYTGNWYLVDPVTGMAARDVLGNPIIVFAVGDPTLDLRIWDRDIAVDVTGKSVPVGENLTFRIDTNMYQALMPANRPDVVGANPGFITIKVKDETGATLNYLYQDNSTANSLKNLSVDMSGWFWGGGNSGGSKFWATGLIDEDQYLYYPVGTYVAWAESSLNGMKDNYRNAGADYTGKTVSQTYTITLVHDTLSIQANKNSVVRSRPFSVTIYGRPLATYHVWVANTGSMRGGYDDQPPFIGLNQAGAGWGSDPGLTRVAPVYPDAGAYRFSNGGGRAIYQDVAPGWPGATSAVLANGSRMYANVTASTSGTRTLELMTTNWTKPGQYTIRVEQVFPVGDSWMSGEVKKDEVKVTVRRGEVTVAAAGTQQYFPGDAIRLSGMNSATTTTYLFLTGPGLPAQGAQIASMDPKNNPVVNANPVTFRQADVLGDNSWSWRWNTTGIALDPGFYTIHAVSSPRDALSLRPEDEYGTTTIAIGTPDPATSITVHPDGDTIAAHTNVTADVIQVCNNFPLEEVVDMTTDLENPVWSYAILVDGVVNISSHATGQTLTIHGYDLSYKTTQLVTLRTTLQGQFPTSTGPVKVAGVRILDSRGIMVPGTNVTAIRIGVNTASPYSGGGGGDDSSSGPDSSGGGQGAATSPGAGPGQTMTFTFSQSGGPVTITQVQLVPGRQVGTLELIAVPVSPGIAMQVPGMTVIGYQQITPVGLNPSAIDHGTISFGVSSSWLTGHGVIPANIVMMRYHDGAWAALPTRFDHESGRISYFAADTPGLSYFAVAIKAPGSPAGNTSGPSDTGVTGEPVSSSIAAAATNMYGGAPGPAKTEVTRTPAVASPVTPSGGTGIPVVTAVLGIVACALLATGVVIVRRWWIRRQNPALFRDL